MPRRPRMHVGNTKKGFTLLEMSVSLIIIGMLLAGAVQIYRIYQENKAMTLTNRVVADLSIKIYEFKNAHGRYPCPAPILETRVNNPNHGMETNCADPNIGTAAPVAPGTCLDGTVGPDNFNGICVERSTRTIAGLNPRVRVGGIPFRTLQIEEKDTIDGYGNRIVYSVTEEMAVTNTYKDSIAAIELRDGAGNVLSNGDRSLAFFLFSPGKNKNGAVNESGVPAPCVTGGTNFDGENCRDFASTTNTDAVYVMDAQASGNNQFDDIVEYFVPTEVALWRRENDTSENIVDMSERFVGVGTNTASDITAPLSIKQSTLNNTTNINDSRNLSTTDTNATYSNFQSGALRVGAAAGGGHIGGTFASEYCDELGNNCFDPELIQGSTGTNCATGQYMTALSGGAAECGDVLTSCPSGYILKGFDASGTPQCISVASMATDCSPTSVSMCGQAYSLPLATNGQYSNWLTYTTGGACAYRLYRCNAGTWVVNNDYADTFRCSFTSSITTTQTVSRSCGLITGYTGGTYNVTQTQLCDGSWYDSGGNTYLTDCTCVGVSATDVYCSAAYGGAKIGTRRRDCTGNVLNSAETFMDLGGNTYPSLSALESAKCSCTLSDSVTFQNCPTGQIRNPAAPTPSIFTSVGVSWPASSTAGVYTHYAANLASCTTSSTTDASNCVCDPSAVQFVAVTPTCSACQSVKTYGQKRQIRGGAGCGWIDDPNTSANTTGTCETRDFEWNKTGGQVAAPSETDSPAIPRCGHSSSTCNECSEVGRTDGACKQHSDGRWYFFQATCQMD